MQNKEIQYHINCSAKDIGKYCILPGDPGRCKAIATLFDNPQHIGQNREYNIYTGYLHGEKVSVVSTGIGGPSTAIAVEELVANGAHTFIRVGTCGGIDLEVQSGDVVIATGAVRQDGTSREYAPLSFPAVPDFNVATALVEVSKKSNLTYHTGVVQSKDSFYGQHSANRMPTSTQLREQWTAWKRLGVLASEMEASTLFTVSASLRVRSGAVFHVVWNQERELAGLDQNESHDTNLAVTLAVNALKELILQDKA